MNKFEEIIRVLEWLGTTDVYEGGNLTEEEGRREIVELNKRLNESYERVKEKKRLEMDDVDMESMIRLMLVYIQVGSRSMMERKKKEARKSVERCKRLMDVLMDSTDITRDARIVNVLIRLVVMRGLLRVEEGAEAVIEVMSEFSSKYLIMKDMDVYSVVLYHTILSVAYLSTNNIPSYYNRVQTLRDYIYQITRIRSSSPLPQILLSHVICVNSTDKQSTNPTVLSCCLVLNLLFECMINDTDARYKNTISHVYQMIEDKPHRFVESIQTLLSYANSLHHPADSINDGHVPADNSKKKKRGLSGNIPIVRSNTKEGYTIKVGAANNNISSNSLEAKHALKRNKSAHANISHREGSRTSGSQNNKNEKAMDGLISMDIKHHPKKREISQSVMFFKGLTIEESEQKTIEASYPTYRFTSTEENTSNSKSAKYTSLMNRKNATRETSKVGVNQAENTMTSAPHSLRNLGTHRRSITSNPKVVEKRRIHFHNNQDISMTKRSPRETSKKSQRAASQEEKFKEDPWIKPDDKQHTGIKIVRDRFEQSHHIRSYSNFIVYLKKERESSYNDNMILKSFRNKKNVTFEPVDDGVKVFLGHQTESTQRYLRNSLERNELTSPRIEEISSPIIKTDFVSPQHSKGGSRRHGSIISIQAALENDKEVLNEKKVIPQFITNSNHRSSRSELMKTKNTKLWENLRSERPETSTEAFKKECSSSKEKKTVKVKVDIPQFSKRNFSKMYGLFERKPKKVLLVRQEKLVADIGSSFNNAQNDKSEEQKKISEQQFRGGIRMSEELPDNQMRHATELELITDKVGSSEGFQDANSQSNSHVAKSNSSKKKLRPGKSSETNEQIKMRSPKKESKGYKALNLPVNLEEERDGSSLKRKRSMAVDSVNQDQLSPSIIDSSKIMLLDQNKFRKVGKVAGTLISNYKSRMNQSRMNSQKPNDSLGAEGIMKYSNTRYASQNIDENIADVSRFEEYKPQGMNSMLDQSSSSNKLSPRKIIQLDAEVSESQRSRSHGKSNPLKKKYTGLEFENGMMKPFKLNDRSKFVLWAKQQTKSQSQSMIDLGNSKYYKSLQALILLFEYFARKRKGLGLFLIDFGPFSSQKGNRNQYGRVIDCKSLANDAIDRFKPKRMGFILEEENGLMGDSDDDDDNEYFRRNMAEQDLIEKVDIE